MLCDVFILPSDPRSNYDLEVTSMKSFGVFSFALVAALSTLFSRSICALRQSNAVGVLKMTPSKLL